MLTTEARPFKLQPRRVHTVSICDSSVELLRSNEARRGYLSRIKSGSPRYSTDKHRAELMLSAQIAKVSLVNKLECETQRRIEAELL